MFWYIYIYIIQPALLRWSRATDCLVTRDNNKLQTTIYRKPTHTDRLLDQSSYNPTSHKATTIRTLTRRAQLVCDSPDSLQDETDYLNNVFSKNNYNTDFVRRNTHSNTDSNTQTNVNFGPVTTVTLPYIIVIVNYHKQVTVTFMDKEVCCNFSPWSSRSHENVHASRRKRLHFKCVCN